MQEGAKASVPLQDCGHAEHIKLQSHTRTAPICSLYVALGWFDEVGYGCMSIKAGHTLNVNRSDFPVLGLSCVQFPLTFLSNLSTSVACSILRSRSSFCISLIHATRLMYGLWLVLRSIPGSLSDFSISANRKSPPPRLPLSFSPVLSRSLRRFLEKFSLSRLLCLLSLEPIVLFSHRCRRSLYCSSDTKGPAHDQPLFFCQQMLLSGWYRKQRRAVWRCVAPWIRCRTTRYHSLIYYQLSHAPVAGLSVLFLPPPRATCA